MFSRKAGDRLFHTAGPLYAKLRCPVDCNINEQDCLLV